MTKTVRFGSAIAGLGMLAAALLSGEATAVSTERGVFGTLSDGTVVEEITLRNKSGVSATVIAYGATLQALKAPDREGVIADIVLGFDDLESYVDHSNYFGVTVGRYANRIREGRFSLDGQQYQLTINDAPNSLHGGASGFDTRVWTISSVKEGDSVASVTLTLVSPDGDQGYPGTLKATATYSLGEDNVLSITYGAETDRPTVVNMTNHALFNLAGEGAPLGILAHRLTMPASHYTPVDATLIPTGELRPVAGTVFDFREGRVIADGLRSGTDEQIVKGRGYDHNFALDAGLTVKPKLAARLEDPASGRVLEVLSTEPGMQVYTGNFINGTFLGKQGHLYRMSDGIALEPQKFPDSPNQPGFVSARVDPGHPYRHQMAFRLGTGK